MTVNAINNVQAGHADHAPFPSPYTKHICTDPCRPWLAIDQTQQGHPPLLTITEVLNDWAEGPSNSFPSSKEKASNKHKAFVYKKRQ